jgi:hypothetical protein
MASRRTAPTTSRRRHGPPGRSRKRVPGDKTALFAMTHLSRARLRRRPLLRCIGLRIGDERNFLIPPLSTEGPLAYISSHVEIRDETLLVAGPQRRRRKSARCPLCKERFKLNSRGRPSRFCSRSCRQRAYEQRKLSRPHPIQLLEQDIATARVRDAIREIVREILVQAGINLPPPPTKQGPRPPLRLVDK